MKKRSIFIVIVVLILLFFLLRQCARKNPGDNAVVPMAQPGAAPSSSYADNAEKFKRVLEAPLLSVTFTPPPAPVVTPSAPAPAAEPVKRRPAPAKPAVARRPAPSVPSSGRESVSRPASAVSAPSPRTDNSGIEDGVYYVVRQKLERNGTYYVICSIMGDSAPRNFGYSIGAEQYARANVGLVYDKKNMSGWQRVSRIE